MKNPNLPLASLKPCVRWLALVITLFCLQTAHAVVSLPFYEGFDYGDNTLLGLQPNWDIGNGTGTQGGSGQLTVLSSAALSYSGLTASTGNGVYIPVATASRNKGVELNETLTSGSTDSIYVSFLLNIESAPSTTRMLMWLRSSTGSGTAHLGFFVDPSRRLQISKNNNAAAAGTTSALALDTTHMVVLRYKVVNGSSNDEVKLWLDPSSGDLGASEGSLPAESLLINSGTDASSGATFTVLSALLPLNTSTGFGLGTYRFDELRIGRTWASVAPAGCTAASTTNPSNQGVPPGQTANFTVSAGLSTSPTYQWEISTDGGGVWNPVNGGAGVNNGSDGTGGTTNSFTTVTTSGGMTGYKYRCVVSVACGGGSTATSSAATLTVACNTATTTDPSSLSAFIGAPANFTVSAGSSTAPTYQWEISTDNGGSWNPVTVGTGGTTASYTTNASLAATGNRFRCVVSVSCDSSTATSAGATLTVVDPAAVLYRSAASGNWGAGSTWSNSFNGGASYVLATAAPSSANSNIVILSGHTVTINTGTVTADQVTVNSGGTVTIDGGSLVIADGAEAVDFDVSGTLSVAGTVGTITTTGALKFENGGKFSWTRVAAAAIPTATWTTSSTCEIAPTAAGGATPTGLAQAFGNFTWNWPAASASVDLAGALTTINGNLTVNANPSGASAGALKLYNGTAGFITVNIGGDVIVQGGKLSLCGSSTASVGANLNVGGSFTISAANSANIDFPGSGTGAQSLITFTGAGSHNFDQSGTINSATRIFWTVSSASTVNLTGANAVTVNSPAAFTVDGTLNCADKIISGSGAFTLNSGATLGIGHANGIQAPGNNTAQIQTTGGRTYHSGANYIYNGAGAQAAGNGLTNSIRNLTVNNSAGVTLAAPASVTNSLILTSGKLTTGAHKVSLAAAASVSGAGSSAYVVGNVEKSFATGAAQSFNYPIGGANSYRPLALANLDVATGGALLAAVTQSDGEHASIATSGIDPAKNVNRYWTLTPTTIVPNSYDITLNWHASDVDGGANTAAFLLGKYDGSWTLPTVTANTATSITASGLTAFSDFIAGEGASCDAPVIGTSPTPQAVCAGSTATFTASAITGSTPRTNQWQISTDGGSNWDDIPGETATSYTTAATVIGDDTKQYRLVITNACGDTASSAALLTVNPLPTTYNVTGTGSYCTNGAGVEIGLDGSDSGITYLLKLGASFTGDAQAGSGSAISFGDQTNAGVYTVVGSNDVTGCTSPMSGDATVTIDLPPTITDQPVSSTNTVGSDVFFAVTATGTGLTYQWQVYGTNILDDGVHYSGATSDTLWITNLTSADQALPGDGYICTVSGTCTPSAVSDEATLTVLAAVTHIVIEDAADGSGAEVDTANVPSGTSLTVYAIARNGVDAFVANVPSDWSLTSKTGGVVDGDLVPSGDFKSAELTGNVTGTAVIHAEAGAFTDDTGTITVTVGAANAAHSTISPATASKTADGSSTQVITVQARDINDNTITTGGATVVISRTGTGSLDSTTDNGDGTYTATLTSPTTTGSANVTATLGGTAVGTAVGADSSVVTFVAGAVSAAHSTVSPATASKTADGSSTQIITVQARDINDNTITTGGETVVISKTGGGSLGGTTDNGNGTYTATLTSPTTVGVATNTATLGGVDVGTAVGASQSVVTFVAGAASAAHSTVSPATASITADGSTTQVVTVQARDVNDNNLTTGGSTVVISKQSGGGSVGSTTDNGNGTYTATVTAPTLAGSGTFVATLGGTSVGTAVAATSSVITYTAGAFSRLQILAPGETAAAGTGTGKTGTPSTHAPGAAFDVTVNAVDANWNVVSSTDTVSFTSTDGAATLPSPTALAAGTLTASVTLNTEGTFTITATDDTNGGITADTSTGILVTTAVTGDYRSKADGNWNATATWERFNGSAWVAATSAGNNMESIAGVITVTNGRNVTVGSSGSGDQIVVAAGGTITKSSTFTVVNGAGIDLDIFGSFLVTGNAMSIASGAEMVVRSGGLFDGTGVNASGVTSSGTITVKSGGRYIGNRGNSTTVWPTIVWEAGSVAEVSPGVAATTAVNTQTGLNQDFGYLVWGPFTSQSTARSLAQTGTSPLNIKDSLIIRDNNGVAINDLVVNSYALGIGGDIAVTNATLNLASGSLVPGSINVTGNMYFASSGVLNVSSSGGKAGVNFVGGGSHELLLGGGLGSGGGTKYDFSVAGGDTLKLLSNLPLTAGATMSTFTADGRLDLNGQTMSTPVLSGSGIVTNSGAALTLTLGGSGVGNLAGTFSGVIADGGNAISLVKSGTNSATLSGSSVNNYTGGTTISSGTLVAAKDGALGSGNVSVSGSATLSATGGTANDYLGDAAQLAIGSSATVDLNFSGANDTVGSLTIAGLIQAPGEWGSPASGAANQSARFTGTGKLTVVNGIALSTSPSSVSNCPGPVSFTASAAGNPSPDAQWQLSTDNGASWNDISGENTDSYEFTAVAADTGRKFRAVYTNSFGAVTSAVATLTVNQPAVANSDSFSRPAGISMKITIASLLANDPDAENTLSFVGTSATTTNGQTLSNNGTFVFVPANSVNDEFTYTISDGCGTVQGTVSLLIGSVSGQQSTIVSVTDSNATAVFFGIPGQSYTVQRATNVAFDGGVSNFPPIEAPSNGVFSVTDDFGDLGAQPDSAFYRLLVP